MTHTARPSQPTSMFGAAHQFRPYPRALIRDAPVSPRRPTAYAARFRLQLGARSRFSTTRSRQNTASRLQSYLRVCSKAFHASCYSVRDGGMQRAAFSLSQRRPRGVRDGRMPHTVRPCCTHDARRIPTTRHTSPRASRDHGRCAKLRRRALRLLFAYSSSSFVDMSGHSIPALLHHACLSLLLVGELQRPLRNACCSKTSRCPRCHLAFVLSFSLASVRTAVCGGPMRAPKLAQARDAPEHCISHAVHSESYMTCLPFEQHATLPRDACVEAWSKRAALRARPAAAAGPCVPVTTPFVGGTVLDPQTRVQ